MSDDEAPAEWFALQERKPGCGWEDVMSLAAWHDPAVRAEALAVFRDGEDCPTDTEYRMVRRTESVPGTARKPPEITLLEEALFLRMNGERPPGREEATWHDWDLRAEVFLRGLLPPDAEEAAADGRD